MRDRLAIGVTKAINLLDGIDGLAGGVVAIIAASFVCFAAVRGDELGVIVMSAVVGACLGFLRYNLRYNKAPAKVYMGDAGALTLGFLLAAMSVRGSVKAETAAAIVVLALGLLVIDTLLVMAVRFPHRPKGALASRFLRMFHADRNHLHHVLLRYRGNRKRVVGCGSTGQC